MSINGSAVLSFDMTYMLFIHHWEAEYPLASRDTAVPSGTNILPHLTQDEQNALWYVAGYILRKIEREMIKDKSVDEKQLKMMIDGFKEDD